MSLPFEVAIDHMHAGRHAQAEPILRRLLQRAPRDVRLLCAMGTVMHETLRPDQALFFLRQAVVVAPGEPEARRALAEALIDSKSAAEALEHARRAVELSGDSAAAHMLLGKTLEANDRFVEAGEEYRAAIGLDDLLAMAHCHLADLHMKCGEPEEAFARARETAKRSQNFLHQATVAAFSNYASGLSVEQVLAEHYETRRRMDMVGKPHLPPLASVQIDRDPNRRIRVAILSPDLIQHSVTYYSEPFLTHLDRSRFELLAYFPSRQSDATTQRLKKLFAVWHDLPEPNETVVTRLLREDRADIAIDLGGYTDSSILWALRQRVCPVQVSYIGYPNTTAMPNIDYRVVDSLTDPPGEADRICTEKLVRLDPCFLCYGAPTDVPDVSPPPCAVSNAEPIRFGSFNMLGKVSSATKDLWARLLVAVPGSRLVLKEGVFGSDWVRGQIRAAFARRGVDPARLDLLTKTKTRNEHLGLYSKVDIGLDPFPYCGTTTTCEAMLMGVPVVTVAGTSHVSRVGVSLLSAVGLNELIARDADDFIAIASALAGDRARIARLRSTLRARMLGSPLCDARAHAARLGDFLRRAWQGWCAARPS